MFQRKNINWRPSHSERIPGLALVTAESLVKSYGRLRAVDGLSLTIDEGAITAMIGPNGAGKTTTIKMILGLLRPDSGKVEVLGEDP